jgi:hypothetical protein
MISPPSNLPATPTFDDNSCATIWLPNVSPVRNNAGLHRFEPDTPDTSPWRATGTGAMQ